MQYSNGQPVIMLHLFVMVNLTCFGQIPDTTIIMAGDKTISGNKLEPYENTWRMTEVNKQGVETEIGIWKDTVRILKQSEWEKSNTPLPRHLLRQNDQTKLLIRKQYVEYRSGQIRKHLDVAELETLLPINIKIVAKENIEKEEVVVSDIEYTKTTILAKRNFHIEGKGPFEEISASASFELDRPVFDWHLWGILIAGLPLADNYSARFLVHTSGNTTRSPFLWVNASVTGTETVSSGRWGKKECWIVEVDAEVPWTFWIAKGSGSAPIQKIKIDEQQLGRNVLWWNPLD